MVPFSCLFLATQDVCNTHTVVTVHICQPLNSVLPLLNSSLIDYPDYFKSSCCVIRFSSKSPFCHKLMTEILDLFTL